MSVMSGRDFTNQLKALYPDVKILFMSGYTANVIVCHNVVYEEICFIEKPFSTRGIAEKLREVLSEA